MSDRLSAILLKASAPAKREKPYEESMVEAMDKALQNTTIYKAGAPWDSEGEENGGRRKSGIVIRESD